MLCLALKHQCTYGFKNLMFFLVKNSLSIAFSVLLVLTQTDICMQTHLGKTHLAMEPFSVATRACLPTTHPLGVLLRAHTRFMVFNNDLARRTLIAPDGPTDKLLAGESSLQ